MFNIPKNESKKNIENPCTQSVNGPDPFKNERISSESQKSLRAQRSATTIVSAYPTEICAIKEEDSIIYHQPYENKYNLGTNTSTNSSKTVNKS